MSKITNWHWFFLSVLIVIADQFTKNLAETHLSMVQSYPVLPMFDFILVYNTGSAFGFLSQAGEWHRWFFAGFSVLMGIFFTVWLFRLPAKAYLQLTAISLILGGTVGNLYDRLFYGYVVDFILIFYKNFHWPVFNLADSAICVGACLLFIDLCKNPSR